MKKGILIAIFNLLLLSGFMGCNNGSRHVEILSSDTLIEVLADLHISGSAFRINQSGISMDQMNGRRDAYFDWVMRKHHITYQQFDTSFKYYLNETERFSRMYDLVILKIKQKASENKRTPKEELVRKDSLRKDSTQRAVLQKAAMKKDSIRTDSIRKVTLKKDAIQRAIFQKDSIRISKLKKAADNKESAINETLKRSVSKKDTAVKGPVKPKKIPIKTPPPVK